MSWHRVRRVLLAGLLCIGLVSPGVARAVCGDGVLEPPGEECDEGISNGGPTACCSAICTVLAGGSLCRAAAGACDVSEFCDGAIPGNPCPADTVLAGGTPCGNPAPTDPVCDAADSCNGLDGVCHNNNAPLGWPCADDNNLCTEDFCAGGSCTHDAEPWIACNAVTESTLLLAGVPSSTNPRLLWKATGGVADLVSDFGDPKNWTSYALCVYDEDALFPDLIMSLNVPAGGNTCGLTMTRPCWVAVDDWDNQINGYRFLDRSRTNGGVGTVWMRLSDDGGRLFFRASGPNLDFPDPVDVDRLLTQDEYVVVQLVNSDGNCWESSFDYPARINTSYLFRDTQ